jgi:DNA-binding NarL/FixJ family response regulator
VVSTQPDVVLMDIRMPVLDGLEATRRILADPRCVGVRILILTTFDLDEYVFAALRAGASGFLLEDTPPAEIVDAIRRVAAGDPILSPAITRRLMKQTATAADTRQWAGAALALLTGREHDVALALARGLSNAEIGAALHMSAATAKTHVGRLLTKLGSRDRTHLVIAAYEAGLVDR